MHWLIGNGGSLAVCEHISADMTKRGFSAYVLGNMAQMTMLANDEGYSQVYAEQLMNCGRPGDTLIAISSSGMSPNIINACDMARAKRMGVVTFSGFKPDNLLRQAGHINYYVPSDNYGIVEIAHLTILHSIVNPSPPG
jgi:D-sedoheptulose 7-phosphate isomerase